MARESSALFYSPTFLYIIFYKCVLQVLQRLHQYSSGFRPIYTAPQNSTTFYKTPETAKKQTIFLQKIHNSTFLLICRKTNLFIFSALANEDTCRTCISGIYVCYTEKIFFWICFWAFPFRSGYSGVPSSPFFHVAGSSLTCNVTERFGQPCSLPIPNAEKRLPALLPGHLSSAWCCQTERNTCRLSHGCTPFRCGVGLRRYGLRCRMGLHRVPR